MKKSELKQMIREEILKEKSLQTAMDSYDKSFKDFYNKWNKLFDAAVKRKDTAEVERLKKFGNEFIKQFNNFKKDFGEK